MNWEEHLLKVSAATSFSQTQLEYSLTYNRRPSRAEELAAEAGFKTGFASGYNTSSKELKTTLAEITQRRDEIQKALAKMENLVLMMAKVTKGKGTLDARLVTRKETIFQRDFSGAIIGAVTVEA